MGSFFPLPGGGGLPGLPGLPGLTPPGFLSTCALCPTCDGCPGAPSGGGGPGKTTTPTGPTIPGTNIPLPNIILGLPGGAPGSVSVPGASTAAAATAFLSNPVGYLFGNSLLRIAFFILGFIFIIMGLYMIKETKFIVQVPVDAAKGVVKESVKGAAAAAAA